MRKVVPQEAGNAMTTSNENRTSRRACSCSSYPSSLQLLHLLSVGWFDQASKHCVMDWKGFLKYRVGHPVSDASEKSRTCDRLRVSIHELSCVWSGSSPKHVYIPASANVSLLIRRDPFFVTVAEVSAKLPTATEGALLCPPLLRRIIASPLAQ